MMAQFKGKVVWFNNAKGYGFLTADGARDVFCHFSAIQSPGYRSLKEGEPVEFDIVSGENGRPQAAGVQRLHEGFPEDVYRRQQDSGSAAETRSREA